MAGVSGEQTPTPTSTPKRAIVCLRARSLTLLENVPHNSDCYHFDGVDGDDDDNDSAICMDLRGRGIDMTSNYGFIRVGFMWVHVSRLIMQNRAMTAK